MYRLNVVLNDISDVNPFWTNFYDYVLSNRTNESIAYDIGRCLQPFNGKDPGITYRYLEFDTEEDADVFVLRWS